MDILRAIVEECAQSHTQVTLIKVDGYSDDPLHSLADHLAVEQATDEEADTIFDNECRAMLSVSFEDESDKILVPCPSSGPHRCQEARRTG